MERGEAIMLTRDGHAIGRFIPLSERTFVSRSEFDAGSRMVASIDLDRFRADQEDLGVSTLRDPHSL
ncbi:hypothetical protein GCM10009573_32940 [Agromyces bracchium]